MANELIAWLCTPEGEQVIPLVNFERLSYTRAVNDVGKLEIVLPGTFDVSLVRVDGLILAWRNNQLETETAWLVRGIRRGTEEPAIGKVILTAYSGTQLLKRRVLGPLGMWDGGGNVGPADNLIKYYARNVIANFADADRQLSSSLFVVEADTSQCASVSYQSDNQVLLTAAQEIAKAASEIGFPCYFDVVWIPDLKRWELRTYVLARGTDKSSTSQVAQTISVDHGSVSTEILDDDYSNEATVVYVGGSGTGAGRTIVEVEDTARTGRSPYGRWEMFLSSSNDDTTLMENEGRAALQRFRPRRTYSANIISTAASQYGRDWHFGDIVEARAFGQIFDCRVDAVDVTVDNVDGGREHVRALLTTVSDL